MARLTGIRIEMAGPMALRLPVDLTGPGECVIKWGRDGTITDIVLHTPDEPLRGRSLTAAANSATNAAPSVTNQP